MGGGDHDNGGKAGEKGAASRVVRAHGDHSLWRSGIAAGELPSREPESDTAPERFPEGRITEEDARLLNKADAAIGRVNMLCGDLKWTESHKQIPDQAKIDHWNSIQAEAWRDREALGGQSSEELGRVVKRYTLLIAQLEGEKK